MDETFEEQYYIITFRFTWNWSQIQVLSLWNKSDQKCIHKIQNTMDLELF